MTIQENTKPSDYTYKPYIQVLDDEYLGYPVRDKIFIEEMKLQTPSSNPVGI